MHHRHSITNRPIPLALETTVLFELLLTCVQVLQYLWTSKNLFKSSSVVLIRASVSKPHTSEFNGGISLIYVYIYVLYVVRPVHATPAMCRQYVRDLTTHAHLDTFIVSDLLKFCF